jgi:uncharacterized Tic20 family protein
MDQNTDNPNVNPEFSQNQPPRDIPQTPPPGASDVPPPSQPQPVIELSKEAKQWGMFCHLAAFAGLLPIPFANIIGPLIIWLIKKDEFAFVDEQGKESLNFQISMTVYGILAGLLICIFLGFILLPAVIIADVVFVILASIEANKGRGYRYPLTFRIIK